MAGDETWGCHKVRFQSRKQARRHQRRIRHVRDPEGRMRAYRCDECGWWHMGHLPYPVRDGWLTAKQYYALHREGHHPLPGQRPIDATEGLMTPEEVMAAFGLVRVRTVYEWGRAYQADSEGHVQLPGFMTPGRQWRFSRKAVRLQLEARNGK